jgi:NADH-quinone oxidoreductase subunit F
MSRLNQVLLNERVKIGADLPGWLALGGGQGLSKAIADPSSIIPTIRDAGLRGLGGSGFPTFRKWSLMADGGSTDPVKYLIVNGNEDEPGTFKDRLLLEHTPHQVIEGAIIAGLAVDANRLVFYINPHEKAAVAAMEAAADEWRGNALLEGASAALGRPIELKVFRSSGLYIGGEESAAVSSVQGGFPFPKRKPPFPAQSGVDGHPTMINNTETIANVANIMRNGAQWYQDLGLGDAAGTKIYSLSGDVLNPGTYELPMGTPLQELIYDWGGGMLVGKELKAVFTGGPSNTILTKKDIDVPMDFDSVKARRSGLGTGAMIVVSEGASIIKRVKEYVDFFANSSCGQCPPCKIGTYHISRVLTKIDEGIGTSEDIDTLVNLCSILPGSGRCHLVSGATTVLDSSLYHFMDEYRAALRA